MNLHATAEFSKAIYIIDEASNDSTMGGILAFAVSNPHPVESPRLLSDSK
jgi:hypothetical protein